MTIEVPGDKLVEGVHLDVGSGVGKRTSLVDEMWMNGQSLGRTLGDSAPTCGNSKQALWREKKNGISPDEHLDFLAEKKIAPEISSRAIT